MKTSGRDKNRKNGGFTLVELVVILAILAIMAALTTLAVIKWQDWARFKRENEYAQALYLAAQNQLTEYAGTGYLTDFAESMVDPDALADPDDTDYSDDLLVPHKKVTDLTDGDGSAYTGIEKVWRVLDGSGLDDSEKADYSGR
ncbi:MAG: type II secretion system protein, partial [Lachnospiraceae bacterium]|nr:type II secretion system protein [Lachnospiraceae bacterium]